MKSKWIALLFILACAGVLAAGWLLGAVRIPGVFAPTYRLSIAFGPSANDWKRFFATFLGEFSNEFGFVKFTTFPTSTWDETGVALADGAADLALLRSDDPHAGQGRTLMIFRQFAAAFVTDAKSDVESPHGLHGKKIGVVEGNENDRLIAALVSFYGYQSSQLILLRSAEVGKAVKDKRVAAVLVVGPVGPGIINDTVTAIRKATRQTPSILDVEEAGAFARRYPVYGALEVTKGSITSNPIIPSENANTVSVTTRLIARASLPNRVAGEITRIVLATKAKLAATVPLVGQIEAPSTDEVGVLPIHPGTAAYLKGEQQTLLEIVNDNIFTVIFLFGLVMPLFGWTLQQLRKERRKADDLLSRLSELRKRVDQDEMPVAVVDLERQLSAISAALYDQMLARALEPNCFLAALTVIGEIRSHALVAQKIAPMAHEAIQGQSNAAFLLQQGRKRG